MRTHTPDPDRCYICDGEDHGDTFTTTGKGHNFWSWAATQHFDAKDDRSTPRYPDNTTTPEANYVAQHRPY